MLSQSCTDKPLLLTEDPSLAIFAGAKPAMVDATTILNIGALHPGQLDSCCKDSTRKPTGLVISTTLTMPANIKSTSGAPVVKVILQKLQPGRKIWWQRYEASGISAK